jgi:hypothetical protein
MCAVLFAFLGCGHSGNPPVDQKAIAVWSENEKIFNDALTGRQRNDEFDKSCAFFEQTTGLRLHLNYFTFGILPTPETNQDLVRIQAWFRANKGRLYWDESSHSVKVRSAARRTWIDLRGLPP